MSYSDNPIRAYCWEDVISSFLPGLNTFKFKFSGDYDCEHWPVQMWFEEFQDQFWVEEHQWYTEYSISDSSAVIYTISHISDRYVLQREIRKYCHSSINRVGKYDHVTDLIIYSDALTEQCQEHFSHVTSLILMKAYYPDDSLSFEIQDIESLNKIVNLPHVTHLKISYSQQLIKPSVLLQLLKEAPQLSSLTINRDYLHELFNDDELNKYLNKMIQKLEIYSTEKSSFDTLDQWKKFCQLFSSIKQLTCITYNEDFMFYLFKHLPQLSLINLRVPYERHRTRVYRYELPWLEDELPKLGETAFSNSSDGMKIYLFRQ